MAHPKKQSTALLRKAIQVVIALAIAAAVVLFGNDDLVTPVTPAPDNGLLAEKETTLAPSAQSSLEQSMDTVKEGHVYRSVSDVAAYLHRFGSLPPNYITKEAAQAAGWQGGDLWDDTDKKTIGGDYFGNYEAKLPPGHYHEADVNYYGGKRNDDRLVYSDKGDIYYTEDHYDTFKKLY